MTIDTYYYTFGFLVPIDECYELLGFTAENFTAEKREKLIDEWDIELEITDEDFPHAWFDCAYLESRKYEFEVDGKTFIARRFSNDHENGKYLVVGIAIGEMNRFSGKYTSHTKIKDGLKQQIIPLAQNQKWQKAIQKSEFKNCTLYDSAEYSVPFKSFSLGPSVFTTTNYW